MSEKQSLSVIITQVKAFDPDAAGGGDVVI